jgi:hypothetical protein
VDVRAIANILAIPLLDRTLIHDPRRSTSDISGGVPHRESPIDESRLDTTRKKTPEKLKKSLARIELPWIAEGAYTV